MKITMTKKKIVLLKSLYFEHLSASVPNFIKGVR